MHNFSGHDAIINTMSVNEEGVMFSGGQAVFRPRSKSPPSSSTDPVEPLFASSADNGTVTMWDYATGKPFQHIVDVPQPGSLDAESGVFWCVQLSDRTHSRCASSREGPWLTLFPSTLCSSTFDKTGTRLITGGADKTIKVCSLLHSLLPIGAS